MKTLFISNDLSIFDAASQSRVRMRAYAAALGELYIVSAAPTSAREVVDGTLYLHPIHAGRLTRFFALVRHTRRLLHTQRIEVVSAQDPFEHGLAGVLAARHLGIPLHVQLHTDPFAKDFARTSLVNRVRLRIMPYVLRRAVRIRVVASRLKEEVMRRYGIPAERISVLPIFTDLARFRATSRASEQGSLLWVGRFEREKDPLLALEALAAARAAGIDARLTMLGTGSLVRAVEARAKVRGLVPYLTLPGRADPAPYLAKAELVLATSRYEGYGLAVLEALAAGVPVFATDAGLAREAGAAIASSRAAYAKEAAELLKKGPAAPPRPAGLGTPSLDARSHPIPDAYPSFAAYVEAYAADIRATCAR